MAVSGGARAEGPLFRVAAIMSLAQGVARTRRAKERDCRAARAAAATARSRRHGEPTRPQPGPQRGPTAGLASASRLLGRVARPLGGGEERELLGDCRVDADRVVEVRLGRARLDGHGESLRHLARVGAADVQADDPLALRLEADELGVADVVAAVRQGPLERLEVRVVHLDVVLAVQLDRLLLGEPDRAVLERCVHRRRHHRVVHQRALPGVQPVGEQLARLDRDRSELGSRRRRVERLAVDDVADGVDVRHVGLLVDRRHLAVGRELDARLVDPDRARAHVPPDRKEDRVVLARADRAVGELPAHLLCTRGRRLDRRRHSALDEGHAVLLHVGLAEPGHLLVEAAQRDRAHHHRRVVPDALDEAGALESDVRGADDERAAGRRLEGEDVVGSDAQLLCAGDVRVARPAARADDDLRRRDLGHLALLVDRLDRVRVEEGCVRVVVLDAVGHEVGSVPEVEGLDVALHVAHHRLPVVLGRSNLPAKGLGVRHALAEQRRLVHELLWDAADVYAGAAETPRRARRARLDKVADGDLLAVAGGALGAGQSA
mmetsp:Transcript_38834/g.125535  ORF Transcript_38834/g.125535 Transcript_38834/m.125535 type:complete len:549 (-) Transcript_38834:176-1822(-)